MAKSYSVYICSACEYESSRWLGQCPNCKEWSSLEESTNDVAQALEATDNFRSSMLSKIDKKDLTRVSTGFTEFDRVLGGGFVNAEVVLISGEPGIGKSTLLMQVIAKVNSSGIKSVYVTAEESLEQIAIRADRILGKVEQDIEVINAFDVDDILREIKNKSYKLAIIDSIQTIHTADARGLPGGFAQLKAVSSKLVKFAKQNGVSLLLVGQITKSGNVAGPKLIEHLVDAVMQIEGDEDRGFRILRSMKNRYGSVNEVGLFSMTSKGMEEVTDPAFYFRGEEAESKVGVCPVAVMEGNRVLVLEVQALTTATPFSLPKRVSEGISKAKIELLTAIVNKYSSLNLNSTDVYINITGGFKVKDPGLDLAVILAMWSSLKNKPIKKGIVAYGEVSLTGQIRSGIKSEIREKEVKRLGYKPFTSAFGNISNIRQLGKLFTK